MKKLATLIPLIIILVFILTGCNQDTSESDSQEIDIYGISCSIPSSWNEQQVSTYLTKKYGKEGEGSLQIQMLEHLTPESVVNNVYKNDLYKNNSKAIYQKTIINGHEAYRVQNDNIVDYVIDTSLSDNSFTTVVSFYKTKEDGSIDSDAVDAFYQNLSTKDQVVSN